MAPGWHKWLYGSDAESFMPRRIGGPWYRNYVGLRMRLLSAMSGRRLYGLSFAPPGAFLAS